MWYRRENPQISLPDLRLDPFSEVDYRGKNYLKRRRGTFSTSIVAIWGNGESQISQPNMKMIIKGCALSQVVPTSMSRKVRGSVWISKNWQRIKVYFTKGLGKISSTSSWTNWLILRVFREQHSQQFLMNVVVTVGWGIAGLNHPHVFPPLPKGYRDTDFRATQ